MILWQPKLDEFSSNQVAHERRDRRWSVADRQLLLALTALPCPQAQEDGFAPAASVNGQVISQYELRQRILLMSLFRQPGDIPTLAMKA